MMKHINCVWMFALVLALPIPAAFAQRADFEWIHLNDTTMPLPPSTQAGTFEEDRLRRQMQKLEIDIERKLKMLQQTPRTRKLFIGANPPALYKAYVEDIISRIERYAKENYPTQIKGLSGNPKLTFSLKADGTLDEVEIDRSSNIFALDEAAKQIVKKAAPFAPFPSEIRESVEILSITRTFTFVAAKPASATSLPAPSSVPPRSIN